MRSSDFRRMVEALKVAVAATDNAQQVVFANVTFAELAGRDQRALEGAALADLFALDDRRRIQQNAARVADGKAASAMLEARIAGPDRERWVQVVMPPAPDPR